MNWLSIEQHGYPPTHLEVIGAMCIAEMKFVTAVSMVDSNMILCQGHIYPKSYLIKWMEMPSL